MAQLTHAAFCLVALPIRRGGGRVVFPRACYSQLLIVSTKLRRICPLMYPSKSMLILFFFQPNCNFPLQHPTSTMLMKGGIIEAKRNDKHSYKQKFQGPLGYLVPCFIGSLELLFVTMFHWFMGEREANDLTTTL
jgi:hypothetical protein